MNAIILEEIKKIEVDHQVKIIYVCEAGSRAWGLQSEESDYDVRFIYVNTIEWYLSIQQKRDVIELKPDKRLDINGWDIRKALFLLKKSNPNLLEWLHSGTIYLEDPSFMSKIRDAIRHTFSQKACLYHYLNMSKQNEQLLSEATTTIDVKRFTEYFTPIINL